QQVIVGVHFGQWSLVAAERAEVKQWRWALVLQRLGGQQMPHRRGVGATQVEGGLDRNAQLSEAMLTSEPQQLDHRLRPKLTPLAVHKCLPHTVVARRPASSLTPLLEWLAASERTWLALEHVQVVLQVEQLLVPSVRARVASDAAALVPDLDAGRRQ